MSALRFSIVLPCLTDADTLNRCLESLSQQTFAKDRFEVVVVDDFSQPDLSNPALEFSSGASTSGTLIKYLRNPENLGRSKTRNRGFRESSGEIVLFMDVDQVVDPGLLAAFDVSFGDKRLKSVRANSSVWPPLLEKSAYLRYYDSRFLGKRSVAELASIDLDNLPAKYFASGCIAVTRSALELTGGFDEEFRHYGCEDEELGARLEEAGVPLSLCLAAKVFNIAEDLNIQRVCNRFIEYAQLSVPILLKKHPAYARQTLLSYLELPPRELSAKQRFVKAVLLGLLRPRVAAAIVNFLERRDGRRDFHPPSALYRLAIAGYYVQGYRLRGHEVSA